jgi:hypothetical protein
MRTTIRALAAAAVTACAPDPTPEPPAPPAGAATVTVVGWPSPTPGRARFYRNQFGGALLAEVPVTAAGALSYALGPPDGLMAFSPQDGVTVDPPDARYQLVVAVTTLARDETSETGEIRIGTSDRRPPAAGDVVAQLWYVDRAVTVSGAAGGCTYAQRFPAGWSYAVTRFVSLEPYACVHTASATLPPGVAWRWVWLGP